MAKALRLIKMCLILCLVVFGISFSLINSTPVVVNYYIGILSLPLSLLLMLVFSLGAFMGLAVSFWRIVCLKCKNAGLKLRLVNQKKTLEKN